MVDGEVTLANCGELRISTLITAFNYKPYIKDALTSVITQSRQPYEIILVDDGSTDGTLSYVNEAYNGCERLKVIAGAHRGQLGAMRQGLLQCSGDVVCFLDADDQWSPDYLDAVAEAFLSTAAIDFVFTNMCYFGQRTGISDPLRTKDYGMTVLSAAYAHAYVGGATSALAMRRSVAEAVLKFPAQYDDEWQNCADTVFVYGSSILEARKLYIGKPLVRYRVHETNQWFGSERSRSHQLKHSLRVSRMIHWYKRYALLDTLALRWAHLEFKTKAQPAISELRLYVWLTIIAPARLSEKLWGIASMIAHALSTWSFAGRRRH